MGAQWLTVAQVAECLQVSEQTVRRWIRGGQLPVFDPGSRNLGYRIKQEDLKQFVEDRYGRVGDRGPDHDDPAR